MSESATPEVRQAVLRFVAEGLELQSIRVDQVAEDFDLLTEGVLDSFGLLELIASLEQRFGVELDFDDVDPDELTVFGPFCRYVESKVTQAGDIANGNPALLASTEQAVAVSRQLTSPSDPTQRRPSVVPRAIGRVIAKGHSGFVRARDKIFSLLISGSFGSFGSRTVLQLPIRLRGEHRIAIGNDGFIGANSWLQVLDSESDEIAISIGDGVSIAGLCVLSSVGSIRIGSNVSFARNVYIADHTHLYDDPSRPVLEQGVTPSEPVEIGDGSWLGENVLVLPGVRIGKGAVISANSVVNQDVPDHCLAAGSPARVVRQFGRSRDSGSPI